MTDTDTQPTAAARRAAKEAISANGDEMMRQSRERSKANHGFEVEKINDAVAFAIDQATGLYQIEVALTHINRLCQSELYDDAKEMRRAMTEARIHAEEALARLRGDEQG